ncbi:aggregation promoting protein [Lactobacillus xylocopicola]|uniref:Aggregation promoting protein n=1 Tax=Lactobacillus xylocopicola TaxID=2976676 RepID=A0ABN6SJQ6_9LACO|nr:aggregation promoting protein [Lactobacillus xylocopicola]
MKKSKSLILKLIAALALTFSLVAVIETSNSDASVQTVQAARKLSKKEQAAKRWIAQHESGGKYNAKNGVCYGKYQLNVAYLRGDLSPKNQEQTADNYVYSRYGSWVNAKKFWLVNRWY